MMSAPIVGIDVAKATLVVARSDTDQLTTISNTPAGLATLAHQLQAIQPAIVVFEASGSYGLPLLWALWEVELPVRCLNAWRVRQFARSDGQLAKTDAIDAQVLVRFARVMEVVPQQPASQLQRQLGQLQARRQNLIGQQVAETNRQQQTHDPVVAASIERHLVFLAEELVAVEGEMDALIAADGELARQRKVIESMPGVGAISSRLLLATLPELGQASPKEIAALVGVAPYSQESGVWQGQRTIRGGRPAVRSGLYMVVVAATQHNPVLGSFYQRLVGRGKPKRVALVACMRKMIVMLNAMVRDDRLWQPPAWATA